MSYQVGDLVIVSGRLGVLQRTSRTGWFVSTAELDATDGWAPHDVQEWCLRRAIIGTTVCSDPRGWGCHCGILVHLPIDQLRWVSEQTARLERLTGVCAS